MGNLRQKYTDEEWDELIKNPERGITKLVPIKNLFDKLFKEIEHGDQEHRDWIKNKIDNFYNKNCKQYE